jgi:oligogalacturonide transport system substrate-binding protein
MKRFSTIFGVSAAALAVLAGCGSSGGDKASDVKTELPTEDVTIKFAWWGGDGRIQAMQEVAKLYEEKHPNVTVEVEYGAFDGWQQKTLTQISGKTEADVMQVNYNWLYSFGRGKNIFYDMNKVKNFLDLDNWDKTYLKAMEVDGQQSAVPYGMTGRVPIYNTALYSEFGLEYPKTYADMIEAGKVIGAKNTATGADNKYAFENMGKVAKDLFIAQMLFDKTGKVMQEDGKFNYSVDEVAAVFEEYKKFEDAGAFPKFEQEASVEGESSPQWVEGRSGGIYEWNAFEKWVKSYVDGGGQESALQVGHYLQAEEGKEPNVYVKPNFGYAISKNTKNPEVAADFINFIFTDEKAIAAQKSENGLSVNKVAHDQQISDGVVDGAVKDSYEMMDEYKQTVMDPYFEDENVRGERYTAIEAFRTGTKTAKEAATDYVEKQKEQLEKIYG